MRRMAPDHEPHCQHELLTKFEGRLNLLHEVDDDTVIWLESKVTAALAKSTIYLATLESSAALAKNK